MDVSVGLWLFPNASPIEFVEVIVRAEAFGFDECWLGDEGPAGWDPFVIFGAAALRTNRIVFGIGVANPVTRHPGASTLAAMTIDELSNGRCRLGFGAGGELPLAPFGLEPQSPVASLEHALRVARGVAGGHAIVGYKPRGDVQRRPELELWVGSRGPRMNRVASQFADGAFLSGIDIVEMREVAGWAREHRSIHVAAYLTVAFDEALIARYDDTPGFVSGSPERIASALAEVQRVTDASSVGVALISGDLQNDLAAAAEVLACVRAM